jgi:hypothetical protein
LIDCTLNQPRRSGDANNWPRNLKYRFLYDDGSGSLPITGSIRRVLGKVSNDVGLRGQPADSVVIRNRVTHDGPPTFILPSQDGCEAAP